MLTKHNPHSQTSHPPRNSHVPSLKHLASRAAKPVKKEIIKFEDWILSYVPQSIKTTVNVVNERVDSLKEKVNHIFKREERFTPKEQQTALRGYLKTYRVDGQKGHDPKTFINSQSNPKSLILLTETCQG